MKWAWVVTIVACASDAPPLATPTQLNQGLFVRQLIPDGERLLIKTNDGAWWTMPRDGSAPAQTLPGTMPGDVFDVDLDSRYFVGSNADGTYDLLRQPLDGSGSASIVATDVPMYVFALTETGALWVGPTRRLVPVAGIRPVEPDPRTTTPLGFAFDDTNAYHLGGQFSPGCDVTPLVSGPSRFFGCPGNEGITAYDGTIFVTWISDVEPHPSEVWKADAATEHSTKLADADFAIDIVVRDGALYWEERTKIIRANLAGGDQTVIARPEPGAYIYAMAVDATSVYYATSQIDGVSAIWSIPK